MSFKNADLLAKSQSFQQSGVLITYLKNVVKKRL